MGECRTAIELASLSHIWEEFQEANGIRTFTGPPFSRDSFGNFYASLGIGGAKGEEAARQRVTCLSPEASFVFQEWLIGLKEWLAGRTVIIWRQQPIVETEASGAFLRVYARLTAYTEEEFCDLEGGQHV